jgi:hypothetical protein
MGRKINEDASSKLVLTKTDKLALKYIEDRNREIEENYIKPLQILYGEIKSEIEARADLPPDSIGTTHLLDLTNGIIIPNKIENPLDK